MPKTAVIMHPSADWLCERLSQERPEYVYKAARTPREAMEFAPDSEILMALARQVPDELVAAMPKLEWVHALTTGHDNLLTMPSLKSDVAITSSRGIHGPQMAELTIMSLMTLMRRFPEMVENQKKHEWKRWPQPLLFNKTVCIIGLGVIAEALAARLQPFGTRLTGVSGGRSEMQRFDRVYKRDKITEAVANADCVVVLIPYSSETHHIINTDVLSAMKPSSYLVNISRGDCVDEDALVRHMRNGAIAGIALDVCSTEPLPEDSPLWDLPNTIITPHIGGMSDIYHEQVLPIMAANLEVYATFGASGLNNRVNRS